MGNKECDRCGAPQPADKLHHIRMEIGVSPRRRPMMLEAYVCGACYGNSADDGDQRRQLDGDLLLVRQRRNQGLASPYL